jgi:CheY-like chemotaxis protein
MSKILVVDDDTISAGLISHALYKAGYQAHIAIDGWHACQIARFAG